MTRLSKFVEGRSMSELYDTYWVPSALDKFAQNLAKRVSLGDRVLDLGTGTGLVASYAAERSGRDGEIVGYDPTPDLLNTAKAKSIIGAPIQWVEGYSEDMPFDASSFDIVLCHQGLQYVTDRTKTFSEVKRILKTNGRFHASVWSSAADQSAFAFVEDSLAKHIGPEQKPIHAWSFGGLTELKRLAEATGFTVERGEKVDFPWMFTSIQQFVDIQIACAGRTDENGQLAMGLVDLEDERWLPAIEAFGSDAQVALEKYENAAGLSAPFYSDEISAVA